jgi:hypothetical protein
VDHDVSMLAPEVSCRMRVEERDPRFLLEHGYLEKLEVELGRRRVLASRLGCGTPDPDAGAGRRGASQRRGGPAAAASYTREAMTLNDLLAQREAEILDQAFQVASRLESYRHAGEQETRARLRRLFVLTADAVHTHNVTDLVAHATHVARERFESGVDLADVQTAFNVLEEAIWTHALRELPREELAKALGLVATALGLGKDALGRAYVSLASRSAAPSLDLAELFKGTQGA